MKKGEPSVESDCYAMTTTRWRTVLVSFLFVALIQNLACWALVTYRGSTGLRIERSSSKAFSWSVLVRPRSAASAAGVHSGDRLDAAQLTPGMRYRIWTGSTFTSEALTLPIVRNGQQEPVTVVSRETGLPWYAQFGFLGTTFLCLLLLPVAWRRSDRAEVRAIIAMLVLPNSGIDFFAGVWTTMSPLTDAIVNATGNVLYICGLTAPAFYAALFARPLSWTRRALTWATVAAALVATASRILDIVGVYTGRFDPLPYVTLQNALRTLPIPLFTTLALLAALGAVRGAARDRFLWVVISSAPFLFGTSAATILLGFRVPESIAQYAIAIENVGAFVAPLGITYSIVSRRVLDLGFVIGRATVAAVLSAIGIAAFALLEWLISTVFAAFGRVGELVANITAITVVGLMAPSLYRAVGVAVDRTLFSHQYRARAQAARLAAGLPYVDAAATIADVLTHDFCRYLDLPSGALFRRANDGTFVREAASGWEPDECYDDREIARIILQLQADRSVLRVYDEGAGLPGGDRAPALVFPLESHQELVGFVVYSIHADGIDIDPDERALLLEATRQASRGYDALELAARVERSYQARMQAEADARDVLHRTNDHLARMNEAQARFVPSEFLRFLGRDGIADVALGDSTLQTMTVMFCDIRAFTTMSESLAPAEVFAFLNDYMGRVGPLVREHNGFIDKYIGDAVMGLFPRSAADALRAAVAIQRELRIFNQERERVHRPPIAAGIGIHTGPLILGTVGERARMDTTVIADAVNAASRLETATKTFGCSVLISRQSRDALDDIVAFELRYLGSMHVKGKHDALDVFECFSGDTPEAVEARIRMNGLFAESLAAFEAGDLDLARTGFASIVAESPTDGPARFYLSQCQGAAVVSIP